MVGFGSSLRMAQRSGWEGAYLDYESLKLLLSQIEAVYEEEGHRQRQNGEGEVFFGTVESASGRDGSSNRRGGKDYRDELFLESDSDKAFYYNNEHHASIGGGNEYESTSSSSSSVEGGDGGGQQQQHGNFDSNELTMSGGKLHYRNVPAHTVVTPGSHFRPTSSYARVAAAETEQAFSSSEEDEYCSSHKCHPTVPGDWCSSLPSALSWTSRQQSYMPEVGEYSANTSSKKSKSRKHHHHHHHHHHHNPLVSLEDEFFVTTASDDARGDLESNAFILKETDSETNHSQYISEKITGTNEASDVGAIAEAAAVMTAAPSLLNAPFRRATTDVSAATPISDNSSQLPIMSQMTPTDSQISSLYSFPPGLQSVTPPKQKLYYDYPPTSEQILQSNQKQQQQEQQGYLAFGKDSTCKLVSGQKQHQSHQQTTHSPPFVSPFSKLTTKWDIQRKRDRRLRRRRKRRLAQKRRREIEKKVPRHIQVAHAKARAITERFLGLLRAETEKVMLFAQGRLGELADTVGSLRFPTIDDDNNNHNAYYGNTRAAAQCSTYGTYNLSDGGMHPSASSSSDEGAGGGRRSSAWQRTSTAGFSLSSSWPNNISADDSCASDTASSLNRTCSPSAFSVLTQQHTNLSSIKKSLVKDNEVTTATLKSPPSSYQQQQQHYYQDSFQSAQRQIRHFEELRRERPIFQRNDHIVGEDLLLLSAVDEADGYTAVGVELIHVLRYICVNLIAVRKICRKHDRLLMNRMLGGYYHRRRRKIKINDNKRGGSKKYRYFRRDTNSSDMNDGYHPMDEQVQNAQTLGGLLARASGNVFEAHPDIIGEMNHNRLVGLYDVKIQQLANSRTVQVVSSCLALALYEYEVSRSRADALASLNSTASMTSPILTDKGMNNNTRFTNSNQSTRAYTVDDYRTPQAKTKLYRKKHFHHDQQNDGDDNYYTDSGSEDNNFDRGAPSTASGVSLSRLRFAVTSIVALREAARIKREMYSTYLSRHFVAFTGQAVIGEGLDGCSRETLDLLVSYNPDATLLLDPSALYFGLRYGFSSRLSISAVMASSLALALTPGKKMCASNAPSSSAESSVIGNPEHYTYDQAQAVMNALSVFPKQRDVHLPTLLRGNTTTKNCHHWKNKPYRFPGAALDDELFRPITFRLSRTSYLLYTMNYYLQHPTATMLIESLEVHVGYSAAVIGIPCFSAIIIAMLYCCFLFDNNRYSVQTFRRLHILACCVALLGNIVHALSIIKGSIPLALLGRLLLGFSCTEIIHRQMISYCLPVSRVVDESTRSVHFHVIGIFGGLFLGSLAITLPISIKSFGVRSLQSASWVMAFLWLVQLIQIIIFFKESAPNESLQPHNLSHRFSKKYKKKHERKNSSANRKKHLQTAEYDSDSSSTDVPVTTNDMYHHSESTNQPDRITLTYETATEEITIRNKLGNFFAPLKTFASRLRKLMSYYVAIPVSLSLLLYVKYAQEIIFSTCPIIVGRYFHWSGSGAGFFLCVLSVMILPVHYISELIARKYEERTVVKRSIFIVGFGLVVALNYGSLVTLTFHFRTLFSQTNGQHLQFYDWIFGILQYLCGTTISFLALVSLEGATLCLISKLSPPRLQGVIDVGTIVTVLSFFARLVGDTQIVMVELSNRLINTDIVNVVTIPLLLLCIISAYFVKKHFFFLM